MKTLTAVLFLASIGSIEGIKCHVCTLGASGVDTNTNACDDPFNATATDENLLYVDCESVLPSFDACAKTIGTIDGVYTVARACFPSSGCPAENGCVSGNGATVCCCGTDGCNSAGGVVINMAATLALVSSAVMFTL